MRVQRGVISSGIYGEGSPSLTRAKRATDLTASTRAKRTTDITATEASGRCAVCSCSEHQENRPQAGLAGEGCSLSVSRTFSKPCGFGGGGWARQDREHGGMDDHCPAHASEARSERQTLPRSSERSKRPT